MCSHASFGSVKNFSMHSRDQGRVATLTTHEQRMSKVRSTSLIANVVDTFRAYDRVESNIRGLREGQVLIYAVWEETFKQLYAKAAEYVSGSLNKR